jgi:hypothetical protein
VECSDLIHRPEIVTIIGVDNFTESVKKNIAKALNQLSYKQMEGMKSITIRTYNFDFILFLTCIDIDNDEVIFYYEDTQKLE